MPEATYHFPTDFHWGVATAAHQVEGHNVNNDWWAWEQEEGHVERGQTSGVACNWWEDAEADFDRLAWLGVNALRLSVEWSRVEPRPGTFDDAALKRYAEMLGALRSRGMAPMVTLHHFTNPRWLAERGAWERVATVDLYAQFVRRVVEELSPFCDLWCTVNEPSTYAYQGYQLGAWPPGRSELRTSMKVTRNLLLGHAAAYRVIHEVQPEARVGIAHSMRVFDPAHPHSLLDRRAAAILDRAHNRSTLIAFRRGLWLPPLGFGLALKLRRTLDWIGLNYHTRELVAFDRTRPAGFFSRRLQPEDTARLDGGYGEFYPRGIFLCVQRLAQLDLPIYITEDGIPDDDDGQRPRYLLTQLHHVWHAIQHCYPVMGYYYRTLVDSFEWNAGWTRHSGLIALDPRTQARAPRRTARLYRDLIQAHAITPQLIDTYTPDLRPGFLPGVDR